MIPKSCRLFGQDHAPKSIRSELDAILLNRIVLQRIVKDSGVGKSFFPPLSVRARPQTLGMSVETARCSAYSTPTTRAANAIRWMCRVTSGQANERRTVFRGIRRVRCFQ